MKFLHSFSQSQLAPWTAKAEDAFSALTGGTCKGADMTGWFNFDGASDVDVSAAIDASETLRSCSDVCVVIGIGGSYLGAKAVAEALVPDNDRLIFVGNTLSGEYYQRVLHRLQGRDFSVVAISKSGTTTEPALALRMFAGLLRERYGDGASKRVVAVTNPNGGALRDIATDNNWKILTIPDSVGGRYSIFTAAGLVPLAFAGVDVSALVNGAVSAKGSPVAQEYAAVRQSLYQQGKKIEVLSAWEPRFRWLGEWYKQLFGESEGKDGLGLFPVSLEMTADLHSMGQYMQDGERLMFETFLWSDGTSGVTVPTATGTIGSNYDGFDYVAGRGIDEINRIALDATKAAHIEGGVPCLELNIGETTAHNIGALLFTLMQTCAISGIIQGVNPFDQPGVEAYKAKMKVGLGK